MAQIKLNAKQKRDMARYIHVYRDHPEIYEDLFDQYKADNPNPKINQDLIYKNLNLEDGMFSTYVRETDDILADQKNKAAYERSKKINNGINAVSYDVFERNMTPKDAMQDYPDNSFGNLVYGTKRVGYGLYGAVTSMGKGLSEVFVGIPADVGSYALSKATGKDLQTQVLKKIDEDFPSINLTGTSSFIGTAGQFIGGYKIGEKILLRPAVKKVKELIKRKTATVTGKIAATAPTAVSSIAQQTVKYATPALIGEPLVATSTDRTVLQALSPLTEKYMGFKLADDMVDPRDPNLSPKDRALAVLKQKTRFGLEAPLVVGGLSVGLNSVGKFASPYLLAAASKGKGALGWTFDVGKSVLANKYVYNATKKLNEIQKYNPSFGGDVTRGVAKRIPPVEDWKLYNPSAIRFTNPNGDKLETGIQKIVGHIDAVGRSIRTNEALTPADKVIQRRAIAQLEKIKTAIVGNFKVMSNSLHKTVDEMTQAGKNASRWQKTIMTENLIKYVLNPELKAMKLFPGASKDFKIAAANVKREMSTVKRMYGRLPLDKSDLINTVGKNLHEYITTSFRMLDDTSYTLPKEDSIELVKFMKDTSRFDKSFLDKKEMLKKQIDSGEIQGNIDELYEELLEKTATKRINNLINLSSGENISASELIKLANKQLADYVPIQQLTRLKKGQELPPIISKLFGKVDDPKVALTDTIMEFAEAVVYNTMYTDLRRSGLNKVFFNNKDDLFNQKGILTELKQISLKGIGHSKTGDSLDGMWTVPAMKESIETMGGVLWTDKFLKVPIVKTYLAAKSLSQVEKTVLSPTTQIRNVTSAATFALAAGHVGNGASFKQALDFIIKDVFTPNGVYDSAIFKRKMDEYIEQGVVNSSMVVKELDFLVKDSLKANSKLLNTNDLLNRLYDSRYMSKAVDIYRAGDDIWKIYGYEFEKSLTKPAIQSLDDVVKYYREVFKREFDVNSFLVRTGGKPLSAEIKYLTKLSEDQLDAAVKEISADVIKNVYPNYDYVSTFVKNFRRVPFGNFVSFPAEMIRTQGNLVKFGLNELGSSNAIIRKKGAGRVLGLFSALTIPYAAAKTAQKLYGISDRMMDGFQRAFTPEWNQDAPLAITDVSINKDGDTIVKYVPTGYQFPHAQITLGPFYKAFNAVEEGKANGDTGFEIYSNAVLQGLLAVLGPFSSSEIVAGAVADVTTRGGKTIDGKTIYYDHEDISTKFFKKIVHVVEKAFIPGLFVQADKLAKAAFNLFEEDRKNMIYTNNGLPYDIATEGLATIAGVREYTVNIHKSFRKYEISAFTRTLQQTRSKFSRSSGGALNAGMNTNQILEAFETQQLEEYKVFNTFNQTLKAARLWGVEEKEAVEMMLRRKGIQKRDVALLLKGQFNPASLPNFTTQGRIFEILKTKDLPLSEIKEIMQGLAYEMQLIQKDYLAIPLGLTNEKVKTFIRLKKQIKYEKNKKQIDKLKNNTLKEQQSSLTTPSIPVVQPVAQMASNQMAVSPVAAPTNVAAKTTRDKIIEDDDFLKGLG